MNRWSGWITSWEQEVHWDNKITFVYFCICSVRLYIIIYHIYLESVCTAGDGRKYIVGVHCPQNELASVPELETLLVSTLQPGGPPLEAAHAHGRQVGLAPIVLHLLRNRCFPDPNVYMYKNLLECRTWCAGVGRGRRCRRSRDTWADVNYIQFSVFKEKQREEKLHLSKMFIMQLQRTHGTRFILLVA